VFAATFRYARERLLCEAAGGVPPGAPELAVPRVRIALLLRGRVAGSGEGVSDGAGSGPPVVRALEAAIRDAKERAPAAVDALQERAALESWREMLVLVELGGEPIAVQPAAYSELDSLVRPGLDGLVVEVGGSDRTVFPVQMVMQAAAPSKAAVGAISVLTGDPTAAMPGVPGKEAPDLTRDRRLRLSRFRSEARVQLRPGGEPVAVVRAARVVGQAEVSLASLRDLRERLSGHLASRRVVVDGRPTLLASYVPFQDRWQGEASLLQLAIGADALARCGGAARDAARDLLAGALAGPASPLGVEGDPLTSAALLVAISDAAGGDGWHELAWVTETARLCAGRVRPAFGDGAWSADVPPGARGIIALALTRLSRHPALAGAREEADEALAEAALAALLRETTPEAVLGQSPWLGWAMLESSGAADVHGAPLLREARSLLWERQLGAPDAAVVGPDAVGGVLFAGESVPGWQCARPVALAAAMLGETRLTDPADRMREIVRLTVAMRFLRQLCLDESSAPLCPDFQSAAWGARASLWDQRQTLESCSGVLLAVDAVVDALESLTPAPATQPGG